MSRGNKRVFEECVALLGRGDIGGYLRLVDEDVIWIAARSAVEGAYRGHEGLRKFFADNNENFEVFEADFREVRDLGDRIFVAGTIHIRGRGSAVEEAGFAPTAVSFRCPGRGLWKRRGS